MFPGSHEEEVWSAQRLTEKGEGRRDGTRLIGHKTRLVKACFAIAPVSARNIVPEGCCWRFESITRKAECQMQRWR